MHIIVHAGGSALELVEPDDFEAFSIVIQGEPDRQRLAAASSGIGRADGTRHVYVEVSALRALAGSRAQNERWCRALDAMLDSARGSGWLDQSGAVRAHVEWRG